MFCLMSFHSRTHTITQNKLQNFSNPRPPTESSLVLLVNPPSSLPPRQIFPNFFPHRLVLQGLGWHINGIRGSVFFDVTVLLFNILEIHPCCLVYPEMTPFTVALYSPLHWGRQHSVSCYSPVVRHLGWVQFSAITNQAASNTVIHVFS